MDAKLWGEEYNRHNPPKKVDIFMETVYEFPQRPNSPLFHVEHFIEGNYVKYNSNSGMVILTLYPYSNLSLFYPILGGMSIRSGH